MGGNCCSAGSVCLHIEVSLSLSLHLCLWPPPPPLRETTCGILYCLNYKSFEGYGSSVGGKVSNYSSPSAGIRLLALHQSCQSAASLSVDFPILAVIGQCKRGLNYDLQNVLATCDQSNSLENIISQAITFLCFNRWWGDSGKVLCHLSNPGLFQEIEEETGRVLWLPSHQEKCYPWDTGKNLIWYWYSFLHIYFFRFNSRIVMFKVSPSELQHDDKVERILQFIAAKPDSVWIGLCTA